jgi:hypothetical protein
LGSLARDDHWRWKVRRSKWISSPKWYYSTHTRPWARSREWIR